jgi:hypothetical protein
MVVPSLRQLIASRATKTQAHSQASPRFVVDKVTVWQVFLWVNDFSTVSIILPLLHDYFYLYAPFT